MKRCVCVLLNLLVCVSFNMQAQSAKPFSIQSILQPYRLEVAYNKTTHLVFPFSIISIDRGSAGILAEKASGAPKILKVKADQKTFEETNLSVITSDGKLYSFLVCYNENPAYISLAIDSASDNSAGEMPKQNAPGALNEEQLAHYAKRTLNAEKMVHPLKDKSAKMSMVLEGIYVKEDALFFRLRLQNESNFNYDIDQLRIYLRDKAQSKRTAVQETEIVPLWVDGEKRAITANGILNVVVAIPRMTFSKAKLLAIEMTEEAGGRNLRLTLKAKQMMKAQPLD